MTDQERKQQWAIVQMAAIEKLLWRAIAWKHYATIGDLLSQYLSYRWDTRIPPLQSTESVDNGE